MLIELPKFKSSGFLEKKILYLWVKFLSVTENNCIMMPKDLLDVPEISKAIKILEKSKYTQPKLTAYDQYVDAVRTQQLLIDSSIKKGIEQGIELGKDTGQYLKSIEIATKLKRLGSLSNKEISELTGLTINEVENLIIL